MFLSDRLTISDARETRSGYLTIRALGAKAGNVQRYSGAEVGRPDLATVDVWRPTEEVMSAASLGTWAHSPVVVGKHPPALLSARTWKDHAVGHIGQEVIHDGGMVSVTLMVCDQAAIDTIRNEGVVECSAGYDCRLDWRDGVTESGQTYQAVQKDIRLDHLAIVPRGRANQDSTGRDCRLLIDAAPPKEIQMSETKLKAAQFLGDSVDLTTMNDEEARKAAVIQVVGCSDRLSAAYYDGAFNALSSGNTRGTKVVRPYQPDTRVADAGRGAADAAREMMVEALGDAWNTTSTPPLPRRAPIEHRTAPADVETARAGYVDRLTEAWRDNG